MAEMIRENQETNEEHLAEEIRELEHPALASWRTWAMALTGFAVLVLIVGAFMIWETASIARMDAHRVATAPPAAIALHSVQQGLESEPRVFRWEPIAGAANYIFIVREDGDAGDVVVIRSQHGNVVTTTDVESANLTTGRYAWNVEARRADGSRVGYGEGTFAVE